ncbi:hypothetical protein [Actinoplanes sp. NPDC049265]|uniref:hypothetical protein n=1 Tax=Actinoplanes sp. NPDC049265 TaxID=3363902 RepID=UPI0037175DAF
MSARHRLLLPVAAVLFGLTACGSTPAAAPPSSNSGTGAAPAVSFSPATSAPAPAKKTPRPVATKSADRNAPCPSAKTLEQVIGKTDEALPKDWHFVEVECWKTWATANVKGPNTGDGFYLFQHKAGTGWRYHSQGSGYHCEDIGIHEPAPFCQYPG